MMYRREIIAELRQLTREIHAETRRKKAEATRALFASPSANDDCCCGDLSGAGCSHDKIVEEA